MKAWKSLLFFTISFSALAGEFNLVTYNVAGLPTIIAKASGQNGKENHPHISPLLNNYDIVLVQEDFAYHKLLTKDVEHPYKSKIRRSGLFRLGDGLNRFSNFPFNGLSRIKWARCYGTIEKEGGNDCLTPKGFSVATHELRPGVFVDIYNHHGEAGDTKRDARVRAINVDQLIKYIKIHSAGRAVILAGDFNLHLRFEDHTKHLEDILRELNLKDACIDLNCGHTYFIDKVFYRSGHGVDLDALEWSNEDSKFKGPNGNRLSDHRPIAVKFRWQENNIDKKVISLKSYLTDRCIGSGRRDITIQKDCYEKLNFEVFSHEKGFVSLMDLKTHKCLDIKRNSKRLMLYPCHFQDNQRFKLQEENGISLIKAKHSDKCLSIKDKDPRIGTQIIQSKCKSQDHQFWEIMEQTYF